MNTVSPHKMLKTVFKCMNLPFLAVGVASVIFGSTAAVSMGNFEILPAIISLFFAIAIQIGANVLHRYCEYAQCGNNFLHLSDEQMDGFPVKKILYDVAMAFLIMAGILGIGIFTMGGWWTLIIAALLALLIYLYNWGNGALSRSPFAIFFPFLGFGIIGVQATSFLQSAHCTDNPFNMLDIEPSLWLSAISGLLAVNVLIAHNIYAYDGDLMRQRNTFTASMGIRTAGITYFVNTIIVCALNILGTYRILFEHPLVENIGTVLITVINIILGVIMLKPSQRHNPNIQNYIAYAMLLMALWCLFLAFYSGKADDSTTTFFRLY